MNCKDCGKKTRAGTKRCQPCWFKWRKQHPEIVPNYKGGRHVYAKAYIQIKVPNHPYARPSQGTVGEHRLVMEKHLGRYLLPTEVVHHKNGNKHDNRLENLVVISSNAEHIRQHRIERGNINCKFPGCCCGGYMTRGYCKKHYASWIRKGLETPPPVPVIKQCTVCGIVLHVQSRYRLCKKHYLEHYNKFRRKR